MSWCSRVAPGYCSDLWLASSGGPAPPGSPTPHVSSATFLRQEHPLPDTCSAHLDDDTRRLKVFWCWFYVPLSSLSHSVVHILLGSLLVLSFQHSGRVNSPWIYTPSFFVLCYSSEFAQTHVHYISDAIQLSHPTSFSSPQTFPASWSFTMRQLFTLGLKYWSLASASVHPMYI